jgi:arylsulfatase A-like enzyme
MNKYLIIIMIGLLAACSGPVKKTPPNIILIFIDDMGWSDWSCFGNTDARTPNIDRMAAEGIAFEQFYVNSPICSPSRVAISTGMYPQRYGITSYLAHHKTNKERGINDWLDPAAPMLARSLKEAGYMCGHFGKWHMGGQRDVDQAPLITEYGFDESLTNFEGMGPKLLPLTMDPAWEEPRKLWEDAERLGPYTWMQRSKITGGFINAAMDFIKKAESADKPFYVNIWPDDVHSPFFPPVELWGDGKRELYLSVLEEMDRQMATLFEYLRSHEELLKNTLVVICSDNGPELGAGRADGLKGYKTHLYEGGIRSPLIVWGPGLISTEKAGFRNRESVLSAIDLAPSLLTIAGANAPAYNTYDGEVVSETLLGNSNASREKPIYWSRPPDRKSYYGFENLPDLAVREGKWKLLCDYDGGRPMLFDVVSDPGETNDLSTQHPDIAKGLTQKSVDWWQSMQ